ncbi:unnamed protein product [Candida verbasci]|uniref:Serine/threonine-protein phosphatase n=1 Tax=Candida verbasci TaxID=1227364 RepID=A0A9W4TPM0_9ASCO|nr:unnamed protein product [Candida verbasci]
MGNNSSKQNGGGGGGGSSHLRPNHNGNGSPLQRTDTQGSAKSSRSIRSKISSSSSLNQSNSQGHNNNSSPDGLKSPKSMSRKNSSNETGMEKPQFSRNNSSSNILSTSFQENKNLPPSMIQIQPKEPILIRRNTNDTMNTNISVSGLESPPINSPSNQNSIPNSSNNSLHNYPLSPQATNLENNNDSSPILSKDGSVNTNNDDSKSIQSSRASSITDLQSLSKSSSVVNNHLHRQSTTNSSIGNGSGTIDIEDLIQRLLDAGYSGKRTKNVCLKNTEIQLICSTAREIFLSQPSLLELSPPVKVVGDVHGQYGDLIRIFTKCGFPPSTNYLFLGDYVDRGKQSLETILLLLCYKIKYPENFFLLRGNHECANVTRVYGFYDECKRRCNIKTWKLFIDTFNTLPISAIVAGKIFCVHGGLSPVLNSMDEIRNIARPTDVPDFGLLNDLLWSDPADTINEWEDNERGVSYVFSKIAINKFLSKFGFDLVCRAHMVVEDGYEFFNDRTLVTVFSAPNYCGEFDNWGAVMSVSEELLCSFELLDPLDSVALKQVMKKGKQERKTAQTLQKINSR